MLGWVGARSFENIMEADEIALHVGGGMLDAMPHVGLGAEMHDIVGLEVVMDPVERLRVGKIRLHETECVQRGKFGEPCALECDGLVVVEVVHAEHFALLRSGKTGADVVANEAGGAGHEDFHPACDKARSRGALGESEPLQQVTSLPSLPKCFRRSSGGDLTIFSAV